MLTTAAVKAHALALGFDLVAIAPAGPSPDHERYHAWLKAGHAGEMSYLTRHADLKADVRRLLPGAASVILVGLNYARPIDPAVRADPSRGQIAAFALGDDYHDVMRAALIELDGWIRTQTGRSAHGRAFVDSAPVLERSWARQAGLGFIGKNTCLINPEIGSWFFLGGLLVPDALADDDPGGTKDVGRLLVPEALADDDPGGTKDEGRRTENAILPIPHPPSPIPHPPSPISHPPSPISKPLTCGRCTRCLEVCPTGALIAPHELDARRCLSYLTIELRGEIPVDLRPGMGNWVFGCDLCQDVCPWNHRAPAGAHPRLQPDPARLAPPLVELLALERAGFDQRFGRSPLSRTRWEGLLRNVCVAAGNWGDPAALPGLEHLLHDASPLIAVHAAWALGRLQGGAGRAALRRGSAQIVDVIVRAAIAAAQRN